jgi:hypothetical protein
MSIMTFNFGASRGAGAEAVRGGAWRLLAVVCLAVAGCTPASAPDAEPIAAVHRAQCGRCHTPPEPHHLAKSYLEDAFARHRGRVHLSPDEWAAMVDYLAVGSARLEDTARTSQQ